VGIAAMMDWWVSRYGLMCLEFLSHYEVMKVMERQVRNKGIRRACFCSSMVHFKAPAVSTVVVVHLLAFCHG
jgi:hypothetical protein